MIVTKFHGSDLVEMCIYYINITTLKCDLLFYETNLEFDLYSKECQLSEQFHDVSVIWDQLLCGTNHFGEFDKIIFFCIFGLLFSN